MEIAFHDAQFRPYAVPTHPDVWCATCCGYHVRLCVLQIAFDLPQVIFGAVTALSHRLAAGGLIVELPEVKRLLTEPAAPARHGKVYHRLAVYHTCIGRHDLAADIVVAASSPRILSPPLAAR